MKKPTLVNPAKFGAQNPRELYLALGNVGGTIIFFSQKRAWVVPEDYNPSSMSARRMFYDLNNSACWLKETAPDYLGGIGGWQALRELVAGLSEERTEALNCMFF